MHGVSIDELFAALNPKAYAGKQWHFDQQVKNNKTLKGVSKVLVQREHIYNAYLTALKTSKMAKQVVYCNPL